MSCAVFSPSWLALVCKTLFSQRGPLGCTQWGDRQRCRRESKALPGVGGCVMTWPHSAGTQAFKKLKKQPQSQRWFHGRKAHPVTLKKPNCLLQREKATSCRRPCSGRNVSGLVVAVKAKQAEAGSRTRELLAGMGAQGLGWGPGERRWLRWARWSWMGKPVCRRWCSFSNLGERTSLPRWDSSLPLRFWAWITEVRKGQFMIHETETTDDMGLEQFFTWGPLLSWTPALPLAQFCGSVSIRVLPKVVPSCGRAGMGWKSSCRKPVFAASLRLLPFLCSMASSVFRCKGPVGLSLTLIFIPGVERNNCELYVPFCGLKRIVCYW